MIEDHSRTFEKRRHDRNELLRGASISFASRQISVRCVVADLSTAGARLIVGLPHLVPERFELVAESVGLEAECQFVWRQGNETGVKFAHPLSTSGAGKCGRPTLHPELPLLIAEDDQEMREFMLDALHEIEFSDPVIFVGDGVELLRELKRLTECRKCVRPGLILLDLNMPRMDGRTVLQQIKSTEQLKHTPVVVFSCSSNQEDLKLAYETGAAGYFAKPMMALDLGTSLRVMINYWRHVRVPDLTPALPRLAGVDDNSQSSCDPACVRTGRLNIWPKYTASTSAPPDTRSGLCGPYRP